MLEFLKLSNKKKKEGKFFFLGQIKENREMYVMCDFFEAKEIKQILLVKRRKKFKFS